MRGKDALMALTVLGLTAGGFTSANPPITRMSALEYDQRRARAYDKLAKAQAKRDRKNAKRLKDAKGVTP